MSAANPCAFITRDKVVDLYNQENKPKRPRNNLTGPVSSWFENKAKELGWDVKKAIIFNTSKFAGYVMSVAPDVNITHTVTKSVTIKRK